MAEVTLVAEPGRKTGSSESRRLRAAGRIPAVLYGHGTEGVSVSVDGRDLRHALSGKSGSNQLLELQVGSERHLALARVLQRHPVRNTVVHVDFQIVGRDEVVSADVPIVLTGEAKQVENRGGMVEQPLTTLTVNATPSRIPTSIELDVTDLTLGEGIRVGDLNLPQGVTTDVASDDIVVIASLSTGAQQTGGEGAAEAGASSEGDAAADSESTTEATGTADAADTTEA
jgi:large subunit ribosomal protein L25